jgi:hypothetical protein
MHIRIPDCEVTIMFTAGNMSLCLLLASFEWHFGVVEFWRTHHATNKKLAKLIPTGAKVNIAAAPCINWIFCIH